MPKASAILEHFHEIGTWVNWELTEDQFLFGDPEVDVRGIAVAWIPTMELINRAAHRNLNLFITHEPAFYPGYENSDTTQTLIRHKRERLDLNGITLLRCHDTWDRMPEFGIVDSWASFLGFNALPRPTESFYRICLTEGLLASEIAQTIAAKIASLGQNSVVIFGDPNRRIERLAIGTGAITQLPSMHELGADACLITDDGMNFWTGGHWSVDLDLPLVVVNHAISELPGMRNLARYLQDLYPSTPVEYFPINYRFSSIHG
jgi:putative NIF3 family GTP cyclohydrolase 1 type 2